MVIHNSDELLALYRVIEAAKNAIEKFEQGEINVRDAVRLIQDAVSQRRAA